MNNLQNSNYLIDKWNKEENAGDEALQEELINAIAERAAILRKSKDKNALINAGYDPNDTISQLLMNEDLSNSNYDDPFNPVFNIFEKF